MARVTPRDEESGSVTIWAVVVITACVALVGLVLDGGVILRARSDAYSLAGAAAREGAQQLLEPDAADGRPVIDDAAARATALNYLADRGATGTVAVTADSVIVTVRSTARLQILTTPSGRTVQLSARAVAHPEEVTP